MAIEKEYGKYIVVCDSCNECLSPEDTHNAARHAAKEAGWSTSIVVGEWINLCPTCKEDLNDYHC